jgi:hypothetical protein
VSTPNGIASSLQTEGAQDVVDVERDIDVGIGFAVAKLIGWQKF